MHCSFLVNLRRVDWVDQEELCIQNRRLPVSPLLRAALLKQLNIL